MPPEPQVVQLALCSSDPIATVRRYTQALGFADAGGNLFWGPLISELHELDEPDASCLVWWLVGRQDFVQLELFQHARPTQRPQAADWRPSDLGWTRFGIAVPDFAAALAGLERSGLTPLSEPMRQDGLRRVAFRDPELGAIVELMEDGDALPGGIRPRFYDLAPALVYAAVSVRDLERARAFFAGTVGLTVQDDVVLHDPALEALWGLEGARRETLVVRGGDVYPRGRPLRRPGAARARPAPQRPGDHERGRRLPRARAARRAVRPAGGRRIPHRARAAPAAGRRDLPARRSGHVAGDPGRAAGVLRPVRLRARATLAGRAALAADANQPTRRERC